MKRLVSAAFVIAAGISALACGSDPAEFTMTNLVLPAGADVWEEVQVTATVKNIGGEEGFYPITLIIDGVSQETKLARLGSDQEALISFAVTRTAGPTANIVIEGLSDVLTINEGVLPVLYIGDSWVETFISDGVDYRATTEVIGGRTINGKETYLIQMPIVPPLEGAVSSVVGDLDKGSLQFVQAQASGPIQQSVIFTIASEYEPADFSLYPMFVGKEVTVTETETILMTFSGEENTEIEANTYVYKVKSIEDITVGREHSVVSRSLDMARTERSWIRCGFPTQLGATISRVSTTIPARRRN